MGTADYPVFGISPSIEDHRQIHKIYSQPQFTEDVEDVDRLRVEYDIENDPNLSIQEKIFCQLLLEDLEATEN